MNAKRTMLTLTAAFLATATAAGCGDEAPPVAIATIDSDEDPETTPETTPGTTPSGWVSQSAVSVAETEPRIAVSLAGKVAVVWTGRAADGSSHIGYAFSEDRGETWTSPQQLEFPAEAGDALHLSPDLTVDADGAFHLTSLAHQRSLTGATVYVASAAAGSTSFSMPEAVTDPAVPGFFGSPKIGVFSPGVLMVSYTQQIDGFAQVVLATDDAGGWQHQQLTQSNRDHFDPDTCASSAGLFTVWRSNGHVSLARYDYDDDRWFQLGYVEASDERNDVAGAPSCAVRDDQLWVSYGLESNVSLGAVRVAFSDDAGETIVGRGTVSDTEAERHLRLPQLALENSDFGHIVYYGGAGHGDESGSLRHVRFATSELPAPPTEPVEPAPTEEADPGLPSDSLHEPVTFQLSEGDERWLGASLGTTVVKGALYVAHVDNDSRQAHVRVVRIDL